MKFRKIFLALLLIFILASSSAWAKNPDKDIIVLYTNDVHCGVDMNIGYAGLVYYKHEVEKKTPYVTLVDAGDAVQGEVIGAISNGRYIIDIMNEVGYDVAIPGNHEFDYGVPQLKNFAENLKCGYISCNFKDLLTGELVFKPYKIISHGDTKIAFVGICTPDSIRSLLPAYFMDKSGNFIFDFDADLTGERLCKSVQNAVDAARAEGADFVIAIGHLGEYAEVPEWSAPFIAAHTRGVDAFIDGHSHEITPCMLVKNLDDKDVFITQSGNRLENIGQITIDTSGKIKTELIKDVAGRDGKTANFINQIKNRYEDTLKTHLGHASFDLAINKDNQRIIRKSETNLGDLICDAFMDAAIEKGGADLAITNSGGIRAAIKSGEVTYNDALAVLPFGKTLCICTLSGQTILDELELGASMSPEEFGGLLQVANVSCTIDTKIKSSVELDENGMLKNVAGERRVKDVMIGGKPLEPDKKYRVISTNYVFNARGNGHLFKDAEIVTPDFITEVDALAHYIKKLGNIPEIYRNPAGQGRIKIIK